MFIQNIISYKNRTLSRDLIIGLTMAISIVIIILGMFYYYYSTKITMRELDSRIKYISDEFTKVISNSLWNLDFETIQQISKAYLNSQSMVGVRIYTSFDETIIDSMPKNLEELIFFEKIINKKNKKVGRIELAFSRSHLIKLQKKMVGAIISVILSVIIVLILTTHFLMTILLNRPLDRLLNGLRVIAGGDYNSHLEEVAHADINSIINEVNIMASEISKRTKELIESEEKYRSIFENALEGIYQARPDGGIIRVNPSMSFILGYDSCEDFTNNVSNILTELYANPVERDMFLSKLFGSDMVTNFECQQKRKDGKPVWISINGRLIFSSNGEIDHIEGQFIDISQRKKAQDELESANKYLEKRVNERTLELKQANEELNIAKEEALSAAKAKSEFLANMSHEIRTPMNGVIAAADLALSENLNQKTEHYLRIIHSSGYSLLGIINDILDFSKIEAGKLDIDNNPFYLDELIETLTHLFVSKANEKSIELIVDMSPDLPRGFIGDSLRLQQIITNLIGNALKFTGKGGIITLGVSEVNSTKETIELQFYVKDTGIGMKEEYLKKLFEPFSQADLSTTRKYGGTGLGLTISKQLVELMGGKIAVESKYKHGTTFYFNVILQKQPQVKEQVYKVPGDISNLNILIIDDTYESRAFLKKNLEFFGFKVSMAETGIIAIEILKKHNKKKPFDLIITDWLMPGMDGIETIKTVRNELKLKTPVIMLTSFGLDNERKKAKDAGIDAFLSKPAKASSIFNAIMDIFGKEHLKMQAKRKGQIVDFEQIKKKLKGFKILLAEDNITNQDIAIAVLEKAGLDVTIANNGLEAYELFKNNSFDAVLMDIQMPELDGYESTNKIREFESKSLSNTKIPIIAMTAHAMKGDDQKCLQAGMDGYVTKPINQKVLFETLWNFLQDNS